MPRLHILDKDEFRRRFGVSKGISLEGEAYVPKGSSTRTRLHELGHIEFGHTEGDKTIGEFIEEELDAEVYAYESMDKKLTYRIGFGPVIDLVQRFGVHPLEAAGYVIWELEERGIEVSDKARENLIETARGYV